MRPYLTIVGPKLLPVRETISSILSEAERREYILEAYIKPDSAEIGQVVRDTTFGQVKRLNVIEILRGGVRLPGDLMEAQLEAGDRLLLGLSPSALAKAQKSNSLELRDTLGEGLEQISLSEGVIVEAVIGPDSTLDGQMLATMNFRQRYRMVPLAVHRRGENLRTNFDRIPLAHGDILLLLGTAEAIEQINGHEDLLMLNRPPVILEARRKKIPLILAVIAGVITAAATTAAGHRDFLPRRHHGWIGPFRRSANRQAGQTISTHVKFLEGLQEVKSGRQLHQHVFA